MSRETFGISPLLLYGIFVFPRAFRDVDDTVGFVTLSRIRVGRESNKSRRFSHRADRAKKFERILLPDSADSRYFRETSTFEIRAARVANYRGTQYLEIFAKKLWRASNSFRVGASLSNDVESIDFQRPFLRSPPFPRPRFPVRSRIPRVEMCFYLTSPRGK